METSIDNMGHAIVYCGWYDYSEECPEDTTPNCTIVALDGDRRPYLARFKGKWRDVNTDNPIDVKYWIRVPADPEPDSDEENDDNE